MILLVCGDRNWTDFGKINSALKKIREKQKWYKGIVTLIHGDCKGADKIAGKIGSNFEKDGYCLGSQAIQSELEEVWQSSRPNPQ